MYGSWNLIAPSSAFVMEAQNWQNTFAPGTNAENMMYASSNGGVLVGTKGIMIDIGSGYSTPFSNLDAVSIKEGSELIKRNFLRQIIRLLPSWQFQRSLNSAFSIPLS